MKTGIKYAYLFMVKGVPFASCPWTQFSSASKKRDCNSNSWGLLIRLLQWDCLLHCFGTRYWWSVSEIDAYTSSHSSSAHRLGSCLVLLRRYHNRRHNGPVRHEPDALALVCHYQYTFDLPRRRCSSCTPLRRILVDFVLLSFIHI